MRKTLTVEIFLTLILATLGVLGVFLLGSEWNAWLIPFYTAIILLAYSARWEFILPAGLLMPFIVALLNFEGSFDVVPLSILIFELIATGLFTYFSYNKWNFDIHPSLVTGIVLGRIFGGITSWLIHILFIDGNSVNLFWYTVNSVKNDVRGLAFQLAVIPFIVILLNKMFRSKKR